LHLLKDVKAGELVEAIRCAARGEAILHPRIASRVIKEFRIEKSGDMPLFSELTDRELEVLSLIAKGYTNSKIAAQLFVCVGTVKGHVSNILSKLQLADRT
jgi:DNA-binding NarL/FixJ family response regulator